MTSTLVAPAHTPYVRRVVGRTDRVPTFLAVGLVATLACALLYVALRGPVGAQTANAVALVISTLLSTALHRRLTFGVRRAGGEAQHQALGLLVLAAGLGISSAVLQLQDGLAPDGGTLVELTALAVANALAGVVRFVSFAAVMRPGATERRGQE